MKILSTLSKSGTSILFFIPVFILNFLCASSIYLPNFRDSESNSNSDLNLIFAINSFSNGTYDELVELSNWCSVAYCISTAGDLDFLLDLDLKEGRLNSSCPNLRFCSYKTNKYVEIIKIFEPITLSDTAKLSATGFIAIDHHPLEKRIYLVFRGSLSVTDWISDLSTPLVIYNPIFNQSSIICQDINNNCLIHQGFYNLIKNFKDQFLNEMLQLHDLYPNYQVIITGHSLGGALANLIGFEFQLLNNWNPLVVSFASPKIGNKNLNNEIDLKFNSLNNFKKLNNPKFILNSNSNSNSNLNPNSTFDSNMLIRVVHDGDYIPKVPINPLYTHSGIEFRIIKKNLPHLYQDVLLVDKINYKTQSNSKTEQPLFPFPLPENPLEDPLDSLKPSKLLHSQYHAEYFIKIYGCNSTDSIVDYF
ncbi:lipase family protein [Ascoidea rubescens DSM 1968]|uniref:triacylglycerol lipase n=1 Tax=Ascoidea rubescens DSM 1968 TaxID=1344418 RepID=A0A1D2VPT1_9ASCO|nr:alpha/beta-hydrolase [Ascoidea rubescens DSM 1968]ODV63620.1 alpha/beta-hydrolase [Ascoidea rubescens DSM 1968]